MLFCSNCGSQLQEGDKFCPNCGTPVTIPLVAKPVEPIIKEAPPIVYPKPVMKEVPKPRRGHKKLIAGVLILLIIFGAIVYANVEYNAYMAAYKSLQFSISDVKIASVNIKWVLIIPVDANVTFRIGVNVYNPSSKSLPIPALSLVIYMEGNQIGTLQTPQFSVSAGGTSSTIADLTVTVSKIGGAIANTILNLLVKFFQGEALTVTFRAVGTAYFTIQVLFLSGTISMPIDYSKTVSLTK